MKTHVLRTSIVALLVAVAGQAQLAHLVLRAHIPFDFVAGGKTLKAGEYTVDQHGIGGVDVRSADGKAHAFAFGFIGECAGTKTDSRLVFHRYGETYLLARIWTQGGECGVAIPADKLERELAAKHKTAKPERRGGITLSREGWGGVRPVSARKRVRPDKIGNQKLCRLIQYPEYIAESGL